MLPPTEALLLALIAVVVVIAVAWYSNRKSTSGSFCSGPYNTQLYDYPYDYPHYESRAALSWDGDRRCAAYCSKSPCTQWCR